MLNAQATSHTQPEQGGDGGVQGQLGLHSKTVPGKKGEEGSGGEEKRDDKKEDIRRTEGEREEERERGTRTLKERGRVGKNTEDRKKIKAELRKGKRMSGRKGPGEGLGEAEVCRLVGGLMGQPPCKIAGAC